MIATPDFFAWVEQHLNDDAAKLRLKYGRQHDGAIDYAAAITQVECRRKYARKLAATLAAVPRFYFPSALAGEQATSDIVAAFHASLVGEGSSLVDLTAGLGIDAMHCATKAASLTAIERDIEKVEALRHNAAEAGLHNIEVLHADCLDFIGGCIASGRRFDVAFIDPARRSCDGSRVFALADCEPCVTAMMPSLARICNRLIIKASPMLDIAHTLAELAPHAACIMAVGTPTECKELLVIIDFACVTETPIVKAVTLSAGMEAEVFEFTLPAEHDCPMHAAMAEPAEGEYIYEASPAAMKSGAFKLLAARYGLSIFHPNTRLFTSEKVERTFPGACYRVLKVLPYASRVLKRFSREYPAVNVAVRNFGMTADALRARLGVRDGDGSLRLYGFTASRGEKVLALVEKVSE